MSENSKSDIARELIERGEYEVSMLSMQGQILGELKALNQAIEVLLIEAAVAKPSARKRLFR